MYVLKKTKEYIHIRVVPVKRSLYPYTNTIHKYVLSMYETGWSAHGRANRPIRVAYSHRTCKYSVCGEAGTYITIVSIWRRVRDKLSIVSIYYCCVGHGGTVWLQFATTCQLTCELRVHMYLSHEYVYMHRQWFLKEPWVFKRDVQVRPSTLATTNHRSVLTCVEHTTRW